MQCAIALHGARLAHSALTVGHCFPSRSPDTRLSLSFVATCRRFGLSYRRVPYRTEPCRIVPYQRSVGMRDVHTWLPDDSLNLTPIPAGASPKLKVLARLDAFVRILSELSLKSVSQLKQLLLDGTEEQPHLTVNHQKWLQYYSMSIWGSYSHRQTFVYGIALISTR